MKKLTDEEGIKIASILGDKLHKEIISSIKENMKYYEMSDVDKIITSAISSVLSVYIDEMIKDEFIEDKIGKAEQILFTVKKSIRHVNSPEHKHHECTKECAEEIH